MHASKVAETGPTLGPSYKVAAIEMVEPTRLRADLLKTRSCMPVNVSVTGTICSAESALAVSDFLAVVKADPANDVAWYDLGVIADQAKQQSHARKDYRAALASHPTYFPALSNLAILETPGDPSGAAALYCRAIAVEPRNGPAHLDLGFLLRSQGQSAAGTSEIATAVSLDPALASRVPTTTTTSPP